MTAVSGTNCGNCGFFAGKEVKPDSFNKQGGVDAPDAKHLAMAKRADLITLPGTAKPKMCRVCAHTKVAMPVTDRMCCAFWDNPGAYREFDDVHKALLITCFEHIQAHFIKRTAT